MNAHATHGSLNRLALSATLRCLLFWGSLAVSLGVAFLVTLPVNRWLISRGRGHALVHAIHTPTSASTHPEHHHEHP